MTYVKIFLAGCLILMAITAGCAIYWTINTCKNADKITEAQIKQMSQPQTIIQRYEYNK